jgi:hypothetical protein
MSRTMMAERFVTSLLVLPEVGNDKSSLARYSTSLTA